MVVVELHVVTFWRKLIFLALQPLNCHEETLGITHRDSDSESRSWTHAELLKITDLFERSKIKIN